MTLPKPEIGLVVHYSYLWASEHIAGAEEGIKNRPCAIVAATRAVEDKIVVTVCPITHSPPFDPRDAVELPAALKRNLGLDDERSWVVVTEFNRFLWPGVDLQPRSGLTPRRYDYGMLPGKFMTRIIEVFDAARRARLPRDSNGMIAGKLASSRDGSLLVSQKSARDVSPPVQHSDDLDQI